MSENREDARPTVGAAGVPGSGPVTPTTGAEAPPGAGDDASAAAPSPGQATDAPRSAVEATPAAGETGAAATRAAAAERAASESAPAAPPARAERLGSFAERPEIAVEIPRRELETRTRRDFLFYAAGVLATAVGAWWLLPDATRGRLVGMMRRERLDSLAARVGLSRERRERVLNRALSFDDDVSEALYSKERRVRTYRRSDVTPLRNNYHGQTPGPDDLSGWSLSLSGLASGRIERLSIDRLLARFPHQEQVTRLVCVEGWSAVAWWGGIRFADLLAAFPPAPGAHWAAMRSTVSLDRAGRPEPYYVSIDLGTALHPQTMLATHQDGRPLTPAHGAPMRLVAPVKLGLKNIKALTDIIYTADEPSDYWNERGYSKYDGL